MTRETNSLIWHKALGKDELPEGRVKQVVLGHVTVAMTHYKGNYGALNNKCPHQGGPLGEGSIEKGLLRCPWHGWDFCPTKGNTPGYDDGVEAYVVEVRDDGVYVGLPEEAAPVTTVSDVMAETMVNWGVKHVFGIVGHSNLGLADGIRLQDQKGALKFYAVRHELAAAFAVSAYGKLTGRPAACLSIAGPGATNLLTGLWDANVDRSPVLALTGQVDTQVIGAGAFQEVDLQAAFGKVAQWTQPVLHSSKHTELMTLACKSALLNRGVSHLIFPDNVQHMPAPEGATVGGPEGRICSVAIRPPTDSTNKAVALLKKSERPVIIVGHGARFNMPAILKLADSLDCPVLTTFQGKGLVPDSHPLGCGVLGRSGTPIASYFMNESDCLLVFGASFSNHTGITDHKPTIQVDFDAMTLGKFHKIDVPVWGEIGETVPILHEEIKGKTNTQNRRAEIAGRWAIWRPEKKNRENDDMGHGINSASIFAALTRHAPDNAIIAVDVGNNTYSFGRYFECEHQAILMSGYLGSIGFSLPAAMGAWAATQEENERFKGQPIISVSGDGGFGQCMADVSTAVKYKMNITHILLNNNELGKISKEQRSAKWEVWKTSLVNPNFSEYVKTYGALGIRVEKKEQMEEAITRALNHDGFSLVEIMSDALLM
jgi:pyruvate oxidase